MCVVVGTRLLRLPTAWACNCCPTTETRTTRWPTWRIRELPPSLWASAIAEGKLSFFSSWDSHFKPRDNTHSLKEGFRNNLPREFIYLFYRVHLFYLPSSLMFDIDVLKLLFIIPSTPPSSPQKKIRIHGWRFRRRDPRVGSERGGVGGVGASRRRRLPTFPHRPRQH